jgi:lipopolysaccharide export system protein LptA
MRRLATLASSLVPVRAAGSWLMAGFCIAASLWLSAGVAAQTAGATGGLGSHDSSLPIEIVADRLTVEQALGRAVFLGNVLAEQGDMLLRADRLVVYYALGDDAADAAPGQAISRIEVEGNVTIASTEETAVGDTGFYDVTGAMIELAGNVVLTREANVIRGDLLEIDVERQIATMTSAPGRPAGERVRALFRPTQDGEG